MTALESFQSLASEWWSKKYYLLVTVEFIINHIVAADWTLTSTDKPKILIPENDTGPQLNLLWFHLNRFVIGHWQSRRSLDDFNWDWKPLEAICDQLIRQGAAKSSSRDGGVRVRAAEGGTADATDREGRQSVVSSESFAELVVVAEDRE